MELHLAVPEKSDQPVKMQTLLENYLQEEMLENDNKYHCENCDDLTVAR